MITNTQRLLYNQGYYPAYTQNIILKSHYKGQNYKVAFEQVKSDRVYKLELQNCCTSYFSKVNIEVEANKYVSISRLRIGDSVLCYTPANNFSTCSKEKLPLAVLSAILEISNGLKVLEHYKLKNMEDFKLLNNNLGFLSEFICSLVKVTCKDLHADWLLVNRSFSYEFLQDLYLACNFCGVQTKLRKKDGKWFIYINNESFNTSVLGKNITYKMIPTKILSLQMIEQDTQSYKITNKINRFIVNTVAIQGD